MYTSKKSYKKHQMLPYLCRFEVVIFQALQNIVFQSSVPGLLKLFCSVTPFSKKVFLCNHIDGQG